MKTALLGSAIPRDFMQRLADVADGEVSWKERLWSSPMISVAFTSSLSQGTLRSVGTREGAHEVYIRGLQPSVGRL